MSSQDRRDQFIVTPAVSDLDSRDSLSVISQNQIVVSHRFFLPSV